MSIAHIDVVRDQRLYGLFPEFKPLLVRSEVTRAISDLRTIRRPDIQAIVNGIPSAWQVNAPTREALVNFLCDRAAFLSENFVSLLWPQGVLDL